VKKFAIICAMIITVFLWALILTGCSATFSSPLEPSAQKITMEEAGNILGVPIPVPTYLPEGYEIQETYVNNREVTLLISDEPVERKLVTGEEAIGAGSQRYEVKCKMRLVMRWYPEGGVPVRLPVEKVKINEGWGFLQDRGDHNALWWDWFPEQGEEAMFEMVLAAGKGIPKEELVKVAESISMPPIREYPLEVMRAVYEKITTELFDRRSLYDKISMTGYSSGWISLSFYEKADPEIVELVKSIINEKVPGAQLIVEENVTSFRGSTREMPGISKEQAIETASKTLRPSIVDRAEISAEIHGWYWEVIFDNLDAEADELMPFPLKGPPPPPPGQPAPDPYPGIWQSVIITVDVQMGDMLSGGARRAPRPGPYVGQEQAISTAREYLTRISIEAPPDITPNPTDWLWIERAKVEAYLSGDIWVVLFWEEGASANDSRVLGVHRIRVSVDAVTGEATGASRG
jgi:hypothetical protein